MHLLPGVAIQPKLELKTRPKQLLGSLLLVIALPGLSMALAKVLSFFQICAVLYCIGIGWKIVKVWKGTYVPQEPVFLKYK
jgi:hypothetical protein